MLGFSGASLVMNIIPMLLIIMQIPSKEKDINSASFCLIFTRIHICNNRMGSGKIINQHSDAQLFL